MNDFKMKSRNFYKIILIGLLIISATNPILWSQNNTELKEQAFLLYTYEEYEMAIPLYDSLFQMENENADIAERLGDCYLRISNPEKALLYYHKVLELSPLSSGLFYNMGSAYDVKEKPDSAIIFFKKYHQTHKTDANVCNRLAILYLNLENSQDSAIVYAQKAISLDPDLANGYYTLSMTYIDLYRFQDAIYAAQAGLERNIDYGLLHMPLGLGYFYLEDYDNAISSFEKGWKVPELEQIFVNYLAFSRLLANTPKEKINGNFENIRFTKIGMDNFEEVLESTKDPQNKYYYSRLIRDFNENYLEFGLDEFIMLYIGFTNDKAYLPYTNNLNLDAFWEAENYDLIQELTENKLDSVPVDFTLYWELAKIAELKSDHYYQLDNLIKYYGFSQAIRATGDGETSESAFIVAYIHHEYEIMYQLGLSIFEQNLLSVKNHSFDILKGRDYLNSERSVYFNIDIPLTTFQGDLEGKVKKKKKRMFFK